jgi:DNA polymerase III alpha subunit
MPNSTVTAITLSTTVLAKELGYRALALTDHYNLCGAMRFTHLANSVGVHGVIGAELTMTGGSHLTLLDYWNRSMG